MHWYGGSIAEAVNLSKQKNAIFVVFIEDENAQSREMASTIDTEEVVSKLRNESEFLAIKLKSGTPNYTHFAQIYQFVPVPSLFFIGRNGTPLEVVCAGITPDKLAVRIDRILKEHRTIKPSPVTVQPSTSSHNVKQETNKFLQSEAGASAPKRPETVPEAVKRESEPAPKVARTEDSSEYEVVCEGDVCVRRPKAGGSSGGSGQDSARDSAPAPVSTPPSSPVDAPEAPPSLEQPSTTENAANIEEKLERAKELIEARRREKAEKEKELEKQKELERRSTGKGVAELKKWQAEQELKNIQEERKREKLEDNLARQRILEQIAQDRAERKARDTPAPASAPATSPVAACATTPVSGDASTSVRIQFKLPDGTSHGAHFDQADTVARLRAYLTDNLQLSSFSLWTAFPRRELCVPAATLLELSLAPSAALLVLPVSTAEVSRPSPFAGLITFLTHFFSSLIIEPSQQIYRWIRERFFGSGNTSTPSSGPSPPRPSPPGRRGNVHRLQGDRGTDDDNNTWNGNSTQQM